MYKDGNKLDPGNYGYISVLSNIHIFSWKKRWRKIELIILSSSIKYRFCKHCYSEHALLDIVGKIQKHMDEKLFSCGIFINLRKA